MEESFPIVVDPDVWGASILIEHEMVICAKCHQELSVFGVFSVIHLLYMLKRHLKEAHDG